VAKQQYRLTCQSETDKDKFLVGYFRSREEKGQRKLPSREIQDDIWVTKNELILMFIAAKIWSCRRDVRERVSSASDSTNTCKKNSKFTASTHDLPLSDISIVSLPPIILPPSNQVRHLPPPRSRLSDFHLRSFHLDSHSHYRLHLLLCQQRLSSD